jgi:hypothetical protein
MHGLTTETVQTVRRIAIAVRHDLKIRSQAGQAHVLVIGIVDTHLVLDTDGLSTHTPLHRLFRTTVKNGHTCHTCHTTVVFRLCGGGAHRKRERRPIIDGTNWGRGLGSRCMLESAPVLFQKAGRLAVCDDAGCRCDIEHCLVIIDELAHRCAYVR